MIQFMTLIEIQEMPSFTSTTLICQIETGLNAEEKKGNYAKESCQVILFSCKTNLIVVFIFVFFLVHSKVTNVSKSLGVLLKTLNFRLYFMSWAKF